jgi:hypothetical protein
MFPRQKKQEEEELPVDFEQKEIIEVGVAELKRNELHKK